jgi:hypothetical protein
MLKRLAAALVIGCALAGCASTGKFNAISFSQSMEMHEQHDLVRPWQNFDTEVTKAYFEPLANEVKKRGHKIYTSDNLGAQLAVAGIVPVEDIGRIWGFNDGAGNIYLDASLGWDEAFATLLHELGHSLQPEELHGDDAQVFAEAIAYIVCYRLGLDTKQATFPYMQGFRNRHRILQLYSRQIDQHVSEILKALVK